MLALAVLLQPAPQLCGGHEVRSGAAAPVRLRLGLLRLADLLLRLVIGFFLLVFQRRIHCMVELARQILCAVERLARRIRHRVFHRRHVHCRFQLCAALFAIHCRLRVFCSAFFTNLQHDPFPPHMFRMAPLYTPHPGSSMFPSIFRLFIQNSAAIFVGFPPCTYFHRRFSVLYFSHNLLRRNFS